MKLDREIESLQKRIAVLERDLERVRTGPGDCSIEGCGDHSCAVNPARGVGTNGGCSCDERTLRRALAACKAENASLRLKISEETATRLREKLERSRF